MICKGTRIVLSDGSLKDIQDIRAGDILCDGHKVKQVIEHAHGPIDIVNIGELRISLWHPIHMGVFWVFPVHQGPTIEIDVNDPAFDIVLESGHYVWTSNDIKCCTLGHGLTDFVARHKYFGTDKILHDVDQLGPYYKATHLHTLRDSNQEVYKWIFYTD